MIQPAPAPEGNTNSDPVLDSLESVQQAISDIRRRLEALPHRGSDTEERHGLFSVIHDHPIETITIAALTAMAVVALVVILLRRR